MKLLSLSAGIVATTLAVAVAIMNPATAHQPVNITAAHAKVADSPVLVDGDISWAVYTQFTRGAEVRHFRFALKAGERLKAEYLIFDRKPENALRDSQLPTVTFKSPSGKSIRMKINERNKFYEPYGGQNYLFLSRMSVAGESGIYTATMRSKRAAQIVVAVGSREVRGEVMNIGATSASCPLPTAKDSEIPVDVARQLIGLSERAGELCAKINGWGIRVGVRDGEPLPVTMDYRLDRITLSVSRGFIVDVTVG